MTSMLTDVRKETKQTEGNLVTRTAVSIQPKNSLEEQGGHLRFRIKGKLPGKPFLQSHSHWHGAREL